MDSKGEIEILGRAGEENKQMESRQIDKKLTKQVRIDTGLHRLLRMKAASEGVAIKTLLEGYIADILQEETSAN